MPNLVWVRDDVVLAIHRRQLAEHGGQKGVRDEGLLASALARPKNLMAYSDLPPDIAALAASYAYGIARNHAFVDGNKRTAFVVCQTFLALNGLELPCPKEEQYLTFLRLAEGNLEESQLGHWIRENSCVSSAE